MYPPAEGGTVVDGTVVVGAATLVVEVLGSVLPVVDGDVLDVVATAPGAGFGEAMPSDRPNASRAARGKPTSVALRTVT
jgi:hypothetical protein